MSFVICEYKKLKDRYPEFQKTVAALEVETLALGAARWKGVTYGGFKPGKNEFGRTTHLPEVYADEAGDIYDDAHTVRTWGVDEFRTYFSSTLPAVSAIPGWKTIMQGGNPQQIGVTPEDIILGIAGYVFTDPSINLSKIKLEVGDITYVKVDMEELHMYEQPALIFEEGYAVPPETHFKLRGFFQAEGYQRIVPMGFILYRRKDFLIHE